jgi:hypothetical protein
MGQELRTRHKIGENVKVMGVMQEGKSWVIGSTGTLESVHFDSTGVWFVVKVNAKGFIYGIETRHVETLPRKPAEAGKTPVG